MQKKNIVFSIVMATLFFGMLYVYIGRFPESAVVEEPKEGKMFEGYKNATYIIEGTPIQLINGVSEVALVPGSASKTVTRYFGNEVRHDFNKDGREDIAFLITQETGGSGTFYYVVASVNHETGWVGSSAFPLGDRIAPQTTEMGTGDIIVVNYAVRKDGEPFTAQPSVGKSTWLLLDEATMQFGVVEKDFEGEADPSRMTLGMKSWVWISTDLGGKKIFPKQSRAFTLDIFPKGTFSATTDCNRLSGRAVVATDTIAFSDMISTKMFCEGSQEGEYQAMLGEVVKFRFTSRGELIFDLKSGGVAVFR